MNQIDRFQRLKDYIDLQNICDYITEYFSDDDLKGFCDYLEEAFEIEYDDYQDEYDDY